MHDTFTITLISKDHHTLQYITGIATEAEAVDAAYLYIFKEGWEFHKYEVVRVEHSKETIKW